jgi:hypothetical protein
MVKASGDDDGLSMADTVIGERFLEDMVRVMADVIAARERMVRKIS